uniref:Opine dehydrogenase domain-containing protein n=1 Tax=Mucochytrium quahogii TaxID=96639 RepID=A0A7S2S4J3_9STRA|mmetsp:Transcript_9307/g.15141  ORF Transcript_9307/g.15141 Transcript_9307/m.15141 type:complete len:409 (-) Transcript_9307:1432-2658(-)|eukprot:CAMPEP_0203770710 /NCGR_PEP_ID=MMETSP0099_2-20121227/2988_1 /ASSEMBLY_ACC=CAM_ASM_000209 /TAXON_ID=96639 /ORGANISM=" , Strain NY0313808BC1" /LENGTH=408 /DNA_ID=CAMNT_0050667929 /DNA_START=505 /DNA_END=1731 /DNA_ORIENTATION=+
MKVTVVGGGNAAQVVSALLSSVDFEANKRIELTLLTTFGDEAERLKNGVKENGGIMLLNPDGTKTVGMPHLITNDVAEGIRGANLILIIMPSFGHMDVLKAMAPFVEENTTVGAFPAQSGFQFKACECLDVVGKNLVVFGLDKLPYNCRAVEYGKCIRVFAYKNVVGVATIPSSKVKATTDLLNDTIPYLDMYPMNSFLAVTLASSNQTIHPCRMYGLFHDYSGIPLKENPLFYESMDELSADLMGRVSNEMQEIGKKITKASASENAPIDLTDLPTLEQGLKKAYTFDDDSSLQRLLMTIDGFKGIGTPMKHNPDGTWEPDYTVRYFTEDTPALCATKGLALLAGVETPTIDMLIRWGQKKIGKVFLSEDNKLLHGSDLHEAGAPQEYNIKTMHELLENEIVGKLPL